MLKHHTKQPFLSVGTQSPEYQIRFHERPVWVFTAQPSDLSFIDIISHVCNSHIIVIEAILFMEHIGPMNMHPATICTFSALKIFIVDWVKISVDEGSFCNEIKFQNECSTENNYCNQYMLFSNLGYPAQKVDDPRRLLCILLCLSNSILM